MQCSVVSVPAIAGGLQVLPKRGSYHIMRAAADAYAKSMGAGDDDEGSSGTPSTPPSTPSSSPPSSSESNKDVSHLMPVLSPACHAGAQQILAQAGASPKGFRVYTIWPCQDDWLFPDQMLLCMQNAAFARQRWIAFLAMFVG